MNKKTINKIKSSALALFLMSFLLIGFFGWLNKAKADVSILTYSLATSDTTPLIKGTVSDASSTVFVTVEGYAAQEATVSEDGTWSLQFDETLETGTYSVGASTTAEGEIISDPAFIYVDEDYPLELYFELGFEVEGDLVVSSIGYTDEYTYSSADGNFSFTFPAGTVITKTGGGTFNLGDWQDNGVDPDNERIILKLRFGVPEIGLSFSHDITITFNVGSEYNGQTLHIFTRSDGNDEDGWEPMDIDCEVSGGVCSFTTSHASYFAVSQYNSIAETEEEMDNNDDDNENDEQNAYISSWKAYRYTTDSSCPNKLKLIIKGKHFEKDAKVRIGGQKAYFVDKKNSKEIVAKFCLDDLLDVKTGLSRKIRVINPDADEKVAKKRIHLDELTYELNDDDFEAGSADGTKNIQQALSQLGLLDSQYITGIYGPITTEAVRKFQEQNGLPNTGFVGPLTKAKLAEKLK